MIALPPPPAAPAVYAPSFASVETRDVVVLDRRVTVGPGTHDTRLRFQARDPRTHSVIGFITFPVGMELTAHFQTWYSQRLEVVHEGVASTCALDRSRARRWCPIRVTALGGQEPGAWSLVIRSTSKSKVRIRAAVRFVPVQ